MNWTEDSWTRQENVVVRVLGVASGSRSRSRSTFDAALGARRRRGHGHGRAAAGELTRHRGRGRGSRRGTAKRSRTASRSSSAARERRIRIASPVLPPGPILGTLVEVVNEQRCEVAGVIDDTQVDDVFRQWETNGVSAWKIPLLQRDRRRAASFSGKPSTPGARTACRTSCTRRSSSPTTSRSSAPSTSRARASGTRRTCSRSATPRPPTRWRRYVDEVRARYPAATPPDRRLEAARADA